MRSMEPGRAAERDPDRTLPHLVVGSIAPAVADGRHAVKRLVGDGLRIGADIFTDGQDLLAARVLYLTPGERRTLSVPMTYSFEDDRWYATLTLDRVGEWRFSVEGWVDRFATWRSVLEKKVGAGQDVASELLEGADQVREAEPHARGDDHHRLADFASLLADTTADRGARVGAALSPELQELMATYGQPFGLTRSEREYRVRADRREAGFAAWYEFFPRSTDRRSRTARHLPRRRARAAPHRRAGLRRRCTCRRSIRSAAPTARVRTTRSIAEPDDPGSPWAIGNERRRSHARSIPSSARWTTSDRFVRRARALGMEVALDYALQCSPDHPWVREHPEWFFTAPTAPSSTPRIRPRSTRTSIRSISGATSGRRCGPSCRDVFLFWIGHGVRIFRVDNPHTKPLAFWEWMIGEVQRQHPDVDVPRRGVHPPEADAGPGEGSASPSRTPISPGATRAAELEEYLTELTQTGDGGLLPRRTSSPNTPDILPRVSLSSGGPPAFRMRLRARRRRSPRLRDLQRLRAVRERAGAEGSEEYLDSEKYQVRVRDWTRRATWTPTSRGSTRSAAPNPALQTLANLSFHPADHPDVLFYVKGAWAPRPLCAVVGQPDPEPVTAALELPLEQMGLPPDAASRWRIC